MKDWVCYLQSFVEKDDCSLRLGSIGDGGYQISVQHLQNARLLISGGLAGNVEFEYDFFRFASNARLILIDPTVSWQYLLGLSFLRLLHPNKKEKVRYLFNSLMLCYMVHTNRCIHVKEWIEKVSFNEHFKEEDCLNGLVVFKCDVEGAEYEILPWIIDNKYLFSSLIIEFHQCDEKYKHIIRFAKSISTEFKLIDFVVNEAGGYGENGYPRVLELSFCRRIE